MNILIFSLVASFLIILFLIKKLFKTKNLYNACQYKFIDISHKLSESKKQNEIAKQDYRKLECYFGQFLHHIGELTLSSSLTEYFNSKVQGSALSQIGVFLRINKKTTEPLENVCNLLNLDKNKMDILKLADDLISHNWEDRIAKYQ